MIEKYEHIMNQIHPRTAKMFKLQSIPKVIEILKKNEAKGENIEKYMQMINQYLIELDFLLSKGENNIKPSIAAQLTNKLYSPIIKHLVNKHKYIIKNNYVAVILAGITLDFILYYLQISPTFIPFFLCVFILVRFIIVKIKERKDLVIHY